MVTGMIEDDDEGVIKSFEQGTAQYLVCGVFGNGF